MSTLAIGYGHNTYAYLAGCMKCGKPYHPDARGWRTLYTAVKESTTVIWLLYCEDCWENWEVMDE